MTGEKDKKEVMPEQKKKSKQFKVGITENGLNTLNQFLDLVNKSSKRRIRVPEVLEFAVEKLTDKDVQRIQEKAYTPYDKMEIILAEYNRRNPIKPVSMEQLKTSMVEVYEKQVLSKLSKVITGT